MRTCQDNDALPLVRAAAEAAVGYLVMRDLVLRQKIRGWQDRRTRRWYVDRRDLRRYIRARVSGAAARAPSSSREGVTDL
jgi:hypothetical protein